MNFIFAKKNNYCGQPRSDCLRNGCRSRRQANQGLRCPRVGNLYFGPGQRWSAAGLEAIGNVSPAKVCSRLDQSRIESASEHIRIEICCDRRATNGNAGDLFHPLSGKWWTSRSNSSGSHNRMVSPSHTDWSIHGYGSSGRFQCYRLFG